MKETLLDRKRFLKLGAYALGAGAIFYGGMKMVDFLTPRYTVRQDWPPAPTFKVYYGK